MKRFFAVLFITILIISNSFAVDAPTLYRPSNNANLSNAASVTLQWYTVSGASGYLVELDTTSSFNSPVYMLSDTYTLTNNNTIANKGINNLFFGKTYYWRVRAVNGNISDTSDYSVVRTFTTASYPTLYSPSNNANLSNAASVTLQWNMVSGASGYLVELDTASSFNSPVYMLSDTYTLSNNNTIANKGINNLYFGKTYYWRARAVSSALNDTSAYSPVRTFTTASYPTLYSPSNNANLSNAASVTLQWNIVSGVSGYLVELDTTSSFNSPVYMLSDTYTLSNNNTIANKGINNLYFGKTYYWRARAVSSALNDTSAYSPVRTFTTASYPTLNSPSNNANLSNAASVTLQWNTVSGASGYLVELDTASSFNSPVYMLSDTYTLSNNNTIANKGINNLYFGKTYYWRARAVSSALNDTSAYSPVRTFTTASYPTLYSPSNNANLSNAASVTLQWNTVSGASGYLVELDTTSSFNSPVYMLSDTYTLSNNNTIANKGINNLYFGKTYYWRARAVSSALNDTSAYSPVRTFTTASYPTLYSPSDVANLENSVRVELVWNRLSGATGYEIEIDTASSFDSPVYSLYDSFTYSGTSGKPYKVIEPLLYGTTYYWRVRATNDIDTSDWSQVRRFTTSACPDWYSPNTASELENSAYASLQWYEIKGTTDYEVEIDTVNTFDSPLYSMYDSFSYHATSQLPCVNVSPLLFGTTYYWRVRAINAIDTSQWSQICRFTTSACPTLYSPNNGITLQDASYVYLVWLRMSGTTGFEVEVDISNTFDSPYDSIYEPSSASYSNNLGGWNVRVSPLLSGTTYYWRVRALNDIDTSDWSYIRRFTTAYQLTTAPTLVSPANGSTEIAPSGVELVWNEIDNVTGYRYQVATDNAFASIVRNGTTAGTNATCNLMYGTTYYWRVQGYNASGNSVWSAVWNFSTQDCQQPTGETSVTACSSYLWHGTNYTESGNYTITVPQSNGCDSVLTLHLTINHPQAENIEVTACSSYEWDGQTYTESGTYDKTFTASNGCDSVVTLHLTINHPQTGLAEATACDSYEWNGETYTESGTYDKTFTASNGCDSVVTLHLTINHPQTENIEATACDSYEWNGETYTESGTYEKTFTASNGCDSVVTLHLTINHPQTGLVEVTACDSYEWNGETYTESGTYEKTFTASNGCDSVVTLQLTINESVQYSFTETATSPYTWNGTEYTETGDYTQNFTAENGCDSIVTLHLNILSGISDIDNSAITIFPNPTSGILNITSTETISEIEIVNALGQVVYRTEVNADNAVCDVEGLTSGVYIVRIYGTDMASVCQQKFIKE